MPRPLPGEILEDWFRNVTDVGVGNTKKTLWQELERHGWVLIDGSEAVAKHTCPTLPDVRYVITRSRDGYDVHKVRHAGEAGAVSCGSAFATFDSINDAAEYVRWQLDKTH